MPGLYDVSVDELAQILDGEPSYRVRQLIRALDAGRRPEDMTDLPSALRDRLAAAAPPALRELARSGTDGGETVKWLWELSGGHRVETVLMHYPDRSTVCVSSQAGCAMGCKFCATGQGGFGRHLTPGEIVEQVVAARRFASPRRVSNVVFMGMGEPLANYDRVWEAIRRLHDGMGFSARHLTVSTVGLVPGIRRMAREDLPVNLAVSLHAANDALRDELVPINRRWPLAPLMQACSEYRAATRRRLSFEWAVIEGVNDSPADARQLAGLARPLGAHVNLIPLNPTPGFPAGNAPLDLSGTVAARAQAPAQGAARALAPAQRAARAQAPAQRAARAQAPAQRAARALAPAQRAARALAALLADLGVNATVRDNRGTDIDAACGQLAARHAADPGT